MVIKKGTPERLFVSILLKKVLSGRSSLGFQRNFFYQTQPFLTTGGLNARGNENPQQQERNFKTLTESLREHGVVMTVEYSETLHDREIVLDNGFVIKIGRGLDYFKGPREPMTIGFCDYDLRPCYQTTVDVYDTR